MFQCLAILVLVLIAGGPSCRPSSPKATPPPEKKAEAPKEIETAPPFVDTGTAPSGHARLCFYSLERKEHICFNKSVNAKELSLGPQNVLLSLDPIKKLTKLRKINISLDKHQDLSFLKWTPKLSILDITAVSCDPEKPKTPRPASRPLDISPIDKLPDLWKLNLGCFDPTGLNALSGLENLEHIRFDNMPGGAITEKFRDALERYTDNTPEDKVRYCDKQTNDDGSETVWCTFKFKEQDEWYFKEALLSLSPLERATQVTSLWLSLFEEIPADLSSLAKMPALKTLRLEIHGQVDLSGLSQLSAIEELEITFTPCEGYGTPVRKTDISFLKGLGTLKKLHLSCMEVENIEPLTILTALTELSLYGTSSKSGYAPLSQMTQLKELVVTSPTFDSLAPLKHLRELGQLKISNTSVRDLSPLSGMTELWDLYLKDTKITDLTPLTGMRLFALSLENTDVRDISALSTLERISDISLEGTQITDLSPLAGLKRLSELKTGEVVDSIAPLTKLPLLESLQLGRYPKEEIPLVKKLECCFDEPERPPCGQSRFFDSATNEKIEQMCEELRRKKSNRR